MSVEFVDTNILVYAFDKGAGEKRKKAKDILADLAAENRGCISTQVLMEFFNATTQKTPKKLALKNAQMIIESLGSWLIFTPVLEDILRAADIVQKYQINFWDAMIVRAASKMGASILWTEDLNHEQIYEGVEAKNPFAT